MTFILPIFVVLGLALPIAGSAEPQRLPWREAGLTERQAAAHLLDRFAYGARPGDVDRVVAMGLETWLERQLAGDLPEPELERRLAWLPSLRLSTREITQRYPNPGLVLRMMMHDGLIERPGETPASPEAESEMRSQMMSYARDKGYRPQRELIGQLYVQKLFRALYAENQLHEVLVDFWFNHFNVSITDNEARVYVLTYERDAIRPYVTGRFRDMLEATAKHPAMLLYLDNARSVADEGAPRTFDAAAFRRQQGARGGFGGRGGRGGFGG
ncbi:MAG: DUF1800 family protein, partial [Acidobacteria bacterium]